MRIYTEKYLAHADYVSQFEINFFVYFSPPDVLTNCYFVTVF